MNFDTFTKFVSALSPIITLCLAILAFHVWRIQLVAKRRFEVAEEALTTSRTAFYALSHIRSPAGFSNEGSTRKQEAEETVEETKRLNEAFIPYERANHYGTQFAALGKSIILSEIHLGNELAASMRVLLDARNRVLGAASSLRRQSDPLLKLTEERQKRINRYEALIWETRQNDDDDPSNNDVLSEEIDAAMATIERLCRAALTVPKLLQSIRHLP